MNVDPPTLAGFGDEWSRFDQSAASPLELQRMFDDYFHIFTWSSLPEHAVGFDMGCGSGRWARLVAPRVGTLHCIDGSAIALEVARRNLVDCPNCIVERATVDAIPLADGSMDFGFSLGVLHHVPDTGLALRECVKKLKIGAPFLLYLYYAFDNRPSWFRSLWQASNVARKAISRMPMPMRYAASQALALTLYWPLARSASALEWLGMDVSSFPLSWYRSRPFYFMRNDALDRFGTRLEQRFSRAEVLAMMQGAGLHEIRFSEQAPFWCAVGRKA
jgi:SAM-dependent methyltransferase